MATIAEAMRIALAHHDGRRLSEAEAAYREILAREPRHVEALNNLGNVLQDGGQTAAAIRCFESALALRPDASPLHFNLANALRDRGDLQRAIAAYRRALTLEPNFADGYYNLGLVQMDVDDFDGALRSLKEAVHVNPNHADAYFNLSWVQQQRRDLSAAEKSCMRSLELRPQHAAAHYNLGWVRRELGNQSGAAECYRRSIELEPDNAVAHFNLGLAYQALYDFEPARRSFSEALRLRPQYAEAECCLGLIHLTHGEDKQALVHFERALEIDPECPEAHYNRGMVLLMRGQYEAGWPEYVWRHRCASHSEPKFDRPVWDGSPLEGRTLMIHCSRGLGDTIQLARYAPEARKRGAGRVLLATHPALHPLLKTSGFGDVVPLAAKDLKYDCCIPVMDLPYVFRSNEETIPPAPYLRASESAIAKWADVLSRLDGFRIGIVWQGSRQYVSDRWRSIPLAQFEPLARVPGVRLISLQKGEGVEQLAEVPFPVEQLGEEVDNQAAFLDTAAIIKNLDLVIASDTSVAHVAAGLGAPIWMALGVSPDWRWMLNRDDSPWYPTLRLFRQPKLDDWPGVFAQMAAELKAMTAARRADR